MKPKLDKLLSLANRGRQLVRRPANSGNDWFRVTNAGGERAELFIYGAIGDYWGDDDVTASAFARALRDVTAPSIDLHINSTGGLVFDGIAIHAALVNHASTVDVYVDGIAASAASFVAMAGDTIAIEKPAKMMIHDAGGIVFGNASDMREAADLLDELSNTIAEIYADRAGGDVETWREAMKVETWYSSAQAVEAGLADRVANDTAAAAVLPAAPVAVPPALVVPVAAATKTPTPAHARGSHNEKGTQVEIEEIMAALSAITDGAKGRNMTNDEVKQYEALEVDLATKRTAAIRDRQTAYETPVRDSVQAAVHVGSPAKVDDGLDKAFENYLRTGRPNADIADLRVTNAQQVGTDGEGGYLVPDGFRQKLVEVRKSFGGLAAEVDSFSTATGNPMEYPTLDDTASAGSITAEEALVADGTDLAFGTINLGAFKYTSAGAGTNLPLRVSVELLQDSAFDIEGLVSRALGTRIQRKQASDWVNGNGTTLPFGLLNDGLTANVVLDTEATLTYTNLLEAEAALDPEYWQNAKWVMSAGTWVTTIKNMVDDAGRPLVLPQSQSGIGGQPVRELLGYPVVIDQACNSITQDGVDGGFMALGDLVESYVIRRVSNLVLVVDPYVRAVNGQVQYLAWERADGNIQNRKSFATIENITT